MNRFLSTFALLCFSIPFPIAFGGAHHANAARETLAGKARYYNESAARLHVHPELKWAMGATLPCKPVACSEGEAGPCQDCSLPSVPQELATWMDVEEWSGNENDGLFSALFLAAEAFRYGATRSEDALAMVRTLLEGEAVRMEITGVPGLFTRQFIPPDIPGLKQPDNPKSYAPDREKDDNRWVKIDGNGCVQTYDPTSAGWAASDHCGLKKYAGWVWLDNVSKDEYSGHLFALGAVAKLVDDPGVRETVQGLLEKVAFHLMGNHLTTVDWDGRITEHGRYTPYAMDDYPGFNAAMALDFIKIAAEATGNPDIEAYYQNCLLRKNYGRNCQDDVVDAEKPYQFFLRFHGLYVGREGCESNYNNISMHMLSLHNLIWFEKDPVIKRQYQKTLEDIYLANHPRALNMQHNAFFDLIFASQRGTEPEMDEAARRAVENAIRMLQEFPERQSPRKVECPTDKCQPYCKNRFDSPTGAYPRSASERCPSVFIWWGDPYSLGSCSTSARDVFDPTSFVLPYWMGRYYGFIGEDV